MSIHLRNVLSSTVRFSLASVPGRIAATERQSPLSSRLWDFKSASSLSRISTVSRPSQFRSTGRLICRSSMKSLKGKHVVITGGSTGIGFACAKRFLREGASVTLMARNAAKLEEAAMELQQYTRESAHNGTYGFFPSPRIFTQAVDVSDAKAVQAAIEATASTCPIDVLVCNAGVVRTGHVEDISALQAQEQVNTNLLGSIYPVQAVLPLLKERVAQGAEPGSIVFMCSLSALSFWYGAAVYTATKYGVRGFAEALRLELLPYDISVSIVCPGFTDTHLLDDAEASGQYMTKLMEVASMYDRNKIENPDTVAEHTLEAIRSGEFLVTTSFGFLPFSLAMLSRGVFPPKSVLTWVAESIASPFVRLSSLPVGAGIAHGLRSVHKHKRTKAE